MPTLAGYVTANEYGATYHGPLLDGGIVTALFGRTDDVHTTPHSGSDVALPGDGHVVGSPLAGTISHAWQVGDGSGMSSIFGNCLVIECPDGESYLFGHFASLAAAQGDEVGVGHPLGVQGSTGQSTGDHVHIGRVKTDINPNFLKDPSGGVSELLDPFDGIVMGAS